MKIEVEKYIKKKIERANKKWARANKNYEENKMRVSANLYYDAMLLFYECVSDLIDGTGFVEEESEVK